MAELEGSLTFRSDWPDLSFFQTKVLSATQGKSMTIRVAINGFGRMVSIGAQILPR